MASSEMGSPSTRTFLGIGSGLSCLAGVKLKRPPPAAFRLEGDICLDDDFSGGVDARG